MTSMTRGIPRILIHIMWRGGLLAVAVLSLAIPAHAGEVSVAFEGGLVTLTAREATVREILQEWARVGHTRLVNAERLPGGPVTLELTRVPEKQAIEVLLRSAAGYLAAPRRGPGGGSQFAQIHVMPPSVAPPPRAQTGVRAVRRPPPVFNPQVPQMLVDDQGNPVPPPDYGETPGEGQTDPALMPPAPVDEGMQEGGEVAVQPQPYPGIQPYTPAAGDPPPPEPQDDVQQEAPEAVAPGATPAPGTLVSPTPGQLPLPAPQDRRPRR
jgi:hypothetical protein